MKNIKPEFEEYIPSYFKDLKQGTDFWVILLTCVFLFSSIWVFLYLEAWDWQAAFRRLDFIGFLLAVITIIPVLAVFYQNRKQTWQNKLPKFLNVKLFYNDQLQLSLIAIPLLDRFDIRAQAQSATTIILNEERGNIFPIRPIFNRLDEAQVKTDTTVSVNKGKPIELYQVELSMKCTLTSMETEKFNQAIHGHIKKLKDKSKKTGYLEVFYPFDLKETTIQTLKKH